MKPVIESIRVFSNAPWEKKVGYCRAIRRGNVIAVSGTTAVDFSGKVIGKGDVFVQTQKALEIILSAIHELGGSKEAILRTRIFTPDIGLWEEIGRAHAEFFGGHVPATSMVQISSLISKDLLVEIEADALV